MKIVNSINSIATKYFKSSFIFDFFAWFPIFQLSQSYSVYETTDASVRLWRLLKLLRIPRLASLLNIEKFIQIVNSYFEKQLQKNIKNNKFEENYPIERIVIIVSIFKIFKLILIIFGISYFFAIFWHIIVKDFIQWNDVQYTDVYNGELTFYTYD